MNIPISDDVRYISDLILVGFGMRLGVSQFVLDMQLPWTIGAWIEILTVVLSAVGVFLGISGAFPIENQNELQ